MFCTTCHSLAVTRAGETKLIGGDIGPELTKVGKQSESRLAGCLAARSPGYLPHSKMPRYSGRTKICTKSRNTSPRKLTDSDLLSDVPQLGAPDAGGDPAGPPAVY